VFHKIRFDKKNYIIRNAQSMKSDNSRRFKEKTLTLELQAGHLDHHVQCPATQVVTNEYLTKTSSNQVLNSGTKNTFYPSESYRSKQDSSQFLVSFLHLTARSNLCPQISWCQLQYPTTLSQLQNPQCPLL